MGSERSVVLVGVRPAAPGGPGPDAAVERWFRHREGLVSGPQAWRLDLVRADPDDEDPMTALLVLDDERSPAAVLDELRPGPDADAGDDAAGAAGVRLCAWAYRPLGPAVHAGGAEGRAVGPFPVPTLYLIGNNVAPGGERELHRWYDEVHVPDTFVHLGFVAARRFWRSADPTGAGEHVHLIAYGVPDGDVDACEARRLELARERVEAAAAGRAPAVPVPAVLAGPRWAGYFRARPDGTLSSSTVS